MSPKSPTDTLGRHKCRIRGQYLTFIARLTFIFLLSHSIDFQQGNIKMISLWKLKCHPGNRTGNILFGSAPIQTLTEKLLSMVSSAFDGSVQCLLKKKTTTFFFHVVILIKQRGDLAAKFTHCAVYCVALRSSWNFINSVSFYSLLIQSFTYCHRGVKFVPLVK